LNHYRTCGAHKLLHSVPFLQYLHELRHLLFATGSDMGKLFYLAAHLRLVLSTIAVKFSLKLSAVYTKWCAQTSVLRRLLEFTQFGPQFRENCRYTWQRIRELRSTCERAVTCENKLKTSSKSAYNMQRNACPKYAPVEIRTHRVPESEREKPPQIYKQQHHVEGNAVVVGYCHGHAAIPEWI